MSLPPDLVPSKQFDIWRRLYTRFGLEPGPAPGSRALLSTVIRPTTNIDDLLRAPAIEMVTGVATPVGVVTFFTVPAGARWHLRALHCIRTAGDRTVDTLYLYTPGGSPMAILTQSAAGSWTTGLLTPTPLLDENWTIRLNITGGATDGTWDAEVLVDSEDAF
jgi:hypothetical protein